MGCSSSKVDNEEGVARCRSRKRFMKHAVASRHAFASAHAQYVHALKGSGAAFRQFVEGEAGQQQETSAAQIPSTPLLTITEALPPPPPPIFPTMATPQPMELSGSRSLHGAVADPLLLDSNGGRPKSPVREERPASPPPPVVPQASVESRDDDWQYYNPPPPPPPPVSSNPPPPPPVSRSSWHNLFLDPFRPIPEVEFHPPSPPPHLVEQRKIKQKKEAATEHIKLKEEEGMPDLEDAEPQSKYEHDDGKEAHLKTYEQPTTNDDSLPVTAMVERNMETSIIKTNTHTELTAVVDSRGRDLLEVFKDVDDQFLKAAESGDPVCRMLETKKVHYHSSFSEAKGIADHSAKVFNSTFWSRSLSRSSSSGLLRDFTVDSVGENGGMMGSHASTLDRLFAWEKKLYDEVKAAEVIRIDLEKKCSLLRSQDSKGEDPLAIDKTRATIKVLHTRFMVALQAVDAASIAVHKLRDEELYPQLVELLEGMTTMWKEMRECHQAQQSIVQDMKTLNNSAAAEATSNSHRQSTLELAAALVRWGQSFSNLISTQKEYLSNLNGWLRLSLIHPDAELRDEQSKSDNPPTKVATTPIYSLCQDWQRVLDKLPDKVTLEAINGFVAIVNEWVRLQSEELKHKKKAESLERELIKKEQFLEMLERKYVDSTPHTDEKEELVTDSPRRAALNENKNRVDQFRLKVELEKEEVDKAIQATRTMTLNSAQSALPGVFSALSAFSDIAYHTYRDLHAQGVNIKLARITG